MQGKIVLINDEKKFGFIAVEGAEKDYFFHQSGLQDSDFSELKEGQQVKFMPFEEDPKGHRAEYIITKGEL